MLTKKDKNKNMLPSEFKDPFTGDCIETVIYEFHKRKSFFRGDCFHSATVKFTSGNTNGRQEFYDDDPNTLRNRVEQFIKDLS